MVTTNAALPGIVQRMPKVNGPDQMIASTIAGRRFRRPQVFRLAYDQGRWTLRGAFGVDIFTENREDLADELVDYLQMLWDDFVEVDVSRLTDDAIDLRRQLLAAVE